MEMIEPLIKPITGPVSAVTTCWRLSMLSMTEHDGWLRQRYKSLFRCFYALIEYRIFTDWIAFLSSKERDKLVRVDPLIPFKPFRAYMTTIWSSSQRLKVIKDSYAFLLQHSPAARHVLLDSLPVTLVKESLGESDGELVIELNHQARFKREGVLSITIICPSHGGPLASIAFSLEQTQHGLVAYVAALQGGSGANPKTIKSSTKAMHGVRPKSMAILATQWYLHRLGVKKILCVRDLRHVSQKKHLIKVPWNKITFSYDDAWSEGGGTIVDENWYELPLLPKFKAREEIKVNKRALYARRYELLEKLSAQMASVAVDF